VLKLVTVELDVVHEVVVDLVVFHVVTQVVVVL